MFKWKEEAEGVTLQIQVTERMMAGTTLLRIDERVVCASLRPWSGHVVLFVNLANWSTTPGGSMYIESSTNGASRF